MTALSSKYYLKFYLVLFMGLLFISPPNHAAEFEWKGQKYKSELKYKLYHGEFRALPDFSTLKPVKTGTVDSFKLDIKDKDDFFAVVFEGYIRLLAGEYTFSLDSDDGSKLFINGKELINHDGLHGIGQPKSAKITLEKGLHAIKVQFFELSGGEELKVQCEGPYFNKQDISTKALFHKE